MTTLRNKYTPMKVLAAKTLDEVKAGIAHPERVVNAALRTLGEPVDTKS